jgi:hypothetical protein
MLEAIEGEGALDFPTVDPEHGRLFVVMAPMERWRRGARCSTTSSSAA